jgi:Polyketide cyclase / dehydrase and lipid transport
MRRIQGQIHIDRPVQEVFDFIADSRNEPGYNPGMRGVTLLTEEPIGVGSQFQATMGRAQMQLLVTITDFHRPNELGSTTTSTLMDTAGTLRFTADSPAGTVMSWEGRSSPRGGCACSAPCSPRSATGWNNGSGPPPGTPCTPATPSSLAPGPDPDGTRTGDLPSAPSTHLDAARTEVCVAGLGRTGLAFGCRRVEGMPWWRVGW